MILHKLVAQCSEWPNIYSSCSVLCNVVNDLIFIGERHRRVRVVASPQLQLTAKNLVGSLIKLYITLGFWLNSSPTRSALILAGTGGAAGADPVKKDRKPGTLPCGSCSSRKRSSGALKAPCRQTIATPTMRAETRTVPTLVRKITTTVEAIKPTRVSRSENWRPKTVSGGSEAERKM
ncbi:unnamed protein product [Fraxinus pennsylvanica]|uniref:Uncharacterized protein n=1 Tax=Fraxinus pennsylvanica TaxID=56036 RepID=A0AAD1Z2B8_9LAMI|nr:unnamed protein product [Fraxinus pennsylvanica]